MTFKKILLFCFILLIIPVQAKESVDKFDYINLAWWKKYNDDILLNHLQTLYNNNHDLKIAALKTKQAEENVRLIGSNQLPRLGFDGSISRVLSGAQTEFGSVIIPEYSQNEFYLPLNASYEIDIWGENFLNRKSAKKQKEIAEQQERAAYIYMTSVFCANYYNLIKACELESILKDIVNLQTQVVCMTEKKYNAGLASIKELLNEKQCLTKYEQDLNTIKQSKKIINSELLVLLGLNSEKEVEHSEFNTISCPETPESVAATVIQYRPDLISAVKYVNKAGLDVRVAKRDFLPKFILYGNLGFNAYRWNRMFANETFLSNIGIAPNWDIFTGGAKLARYRINKYEYKKAVETYEKTVLTSIQEVNDALVETKTAKANLNKSNEDFSLEQEKFKLAQKQFTVGDFSRLDEIKSNLNLLKARKNNIEAMINNVVSTISLYNAVGGIDYTNPENL